MSSVDAYDSQDPRFPADLAQPLFSEPFDFDLVLWHLTDGWREFGVMYWYRVWASRRVWEASARQIGRLYKSWPQSDRIPLHRLFHFLLDKACEYNDDEAWPMIDLLVSEVGIGFPPNPDPDDEDIRLRQHHGAPTSLGRKYVSKSLRFRVFKRDGFTCQYCGQRAPNVIIHCDHVKPVAGGGRTEFDNLITSCIDCNLGKGALRGVDEQLAELKRRVGVVDNGGEKK